MKVKLSAHQYQNELIFYPYNYYGSFGQVRYPVMVDLKTLIQREQKNFILYDDSNVISNTFFTELNKNIQSYGIISLQYDYNNEKLINC